MSPVRDRAGDGVDGARHQVLAVARTQAAPHILVAADDVGLAQHHDMRVGQQVERHRMIRTGRHHHGAGLGDAGKGAGDRDLIAASPRPRRIESIFWLDQS